MTLSVVCDSVFVILFCLLIRDIENESVAGFVTSALSTDSDYTTSFHVATNMASPVIPGLVRPRASGGGDRWGQTDGSEGAQAPGVG